MLSMNSVPPPAWPGGTVTPRCISSVLPSTRTSLVVVVAPRMLLAAKPMVPVDVSTPPSMERPYVVPGRTGIASPSRATIAGTPPITDTSTSSAVVAASVFVA